MTPPPAALLPTAPALAWLRRRAEECALTLLWPGTPRLFARHRSFQRLSQYLLLFNIVVMWVTLQLTHLLMTELDPGTRFMARFQFIGWAEGLLRYMLWTALNFPLALRFRRMWYADLRLSGHLPGVAPAVLFGRQIFWASLVATFLFQWAPGSLHPGALLGGGMTQIGAWVRGEFLYRMISEPMVEIVEILHNAAVSLFRAAAVSYALMAGASVREAVGRAALVYAIGGLLLFSSYSHGIQLGAANAERAFSERQQLVERRRIVGDVIFQRLEALARRGARLAGAPVAVEYGIARFGQQVRQDRLPHYHRQRVMLQMYRREWQFLFVRSYLFPYYFVCIGGASFLLWRVRAKTVYDD